MKTIFKIYKRSGKYAPLIAAAALSMILVTGVNLISPRVTQEIIKILQDSGLPDAGDGMRAIFILSAVLLLSYLLRAVFRFLQSYLGHIAAWKYVSELRADIYNSLQKLSIGYYSDKQTGALMSRVINDTADFEILIAHCIPDLVSGLLLFIGIAVILFVTNAQLAFLTCIPIPLILLSAPLLKKVRKKRKEAQERVSDLNAALQDNFSGIKEIQLFNRQEDEFNRVAELSGKHAGALIKALFYVAVIHPAVEFISSAGNVAVVAFGGWLALSGGMRLDEIVGFLLYLSMFYGPVGTFARIAEELQAGIACGERVFEVLESETDVKEAPEACDAGRLGGEVEFKNVDFNYNDGTSVLKDISFIIPAKKMYAVIGPTGVGKTTLAALIPRFYDVTGGELLIDGKNIKDLTLKSLRSNISMAMQDVFLFNGTIRENIQYGNSKAGDEEIERAAKTACIHDFITGLPAGYDTVVGERGMRLSGGQKQRISIARALLADSPVLILDEATSAVDTRTESEIQEAIQKIAGSRTMLVIAHRLSTVKRADMIIVIKDGFIHERGTHGELMAREGLYRHLVEIQNIG